MKPRGKRLALLASALFGSLLLGLFWLRGSSPLFNLFFPPSGFYEPMAEARLVDENGKYSFEVKHRYPGNYGVVIEAPSNAGVGIPFETDFVADVALNAGKGNLLRERVSEPVSQYWGQEGGGVVLLHYRVPEMVPKGTAVTVSVDISGNMAAFNNKYGKSKVLVEKRSDK